MSIVARHVNVGALRTTALLASVAALALFPLYGDPKPSAAVSHPEWARMILQGLDLLEEGSGVHDTATMAFATLSGRDSRALPADRYVRGNAVEVVDVEGIRHLRPTGPVGEAVYALAIARSGDYRLRLRLAGRAPVEAELAPAGEDKPLATFAVPATPAPAWVQAGVQHFDPGVYDATVLLGEGAVLDWIELAPPCLQPIEPPGGWKPTALATTEDVAVTVLQALDLESELPPAALPLEWRGSDLRLDEGALEPDVAAGVEPSFRAGRQGARVTLLARIPEPGLYVLSVFGTATTGQRWLADGCQKSLVCPSTDPVPRWRPVLASKFSSGPHYVSAVLGPGTEVLRLKLERKKDAPADYVGTVERLGLEVGPSGPITREKAGEARRFLERRRAEELLALCGDILAPGTLVAEVAGAGAGTGGPTGPGGQPGGGGGGGGPEIPPPVIPPLPPASGVVPIGN